MTNFRERLDALESRANETESNEAWDALEPDLRAVRISLFEAEQGAKSALAEAEQKDDRSALARLNPFSTASREVATRIDAARKTIEEHGRSRDRLQQLYERYWADRQRPFLREWVRRAEKIQRGVSGGWETKAAAVAGAVLRDMTTDEVVARTTELSRHPIADRVMLAALIGRRNLDETIAFLAAVKRKDDDALAAAYLLSDRSVDAAVALYERLGSSDPIARAAIASDRTFESIERVRFQCADRAEVVTVGAMLSEADVDQIRGRLQGLLGAEDDVAAYQLLSDRPDTDASTVDGVVRSAIRGDAAAEETIRRAAIASDRSAESASAIVRQLQQQLTGSWTSEATIIAAALLREGNERARRSLALR